MEEKIYDRQVAKQSLSFRVVDQQQIERHFTMNELTELYTFEPDLMEDPSSKKRKHATPVLPKVSVLCVRACLCPSVAFSNFSEGRCVCVCCIL